MCLIFIKNFETFRLFRNLRLKLPHGFWPPKYGAFCPWIRKYTPEIQVNVYFSCTNKWPILQCFVNLLLIECLLEMLSYISLVLEFIYLLTVRSNCKNNISYISPIRFQLHNTIEILSRDFFRCGMKILGGFQVCDGKAECADMEDERSCPKR